MSRYKIKYPTSDLGRIFRPDGSSLCCPYRADADAVFKELNKISTELAAVKAERDDLRAALTWIANYGPIGQNTGHAMADKAREALAKKGGV